MATRPTRRREDGQVKNVKISYSKEWFEILPKLSSHYCRKDSNYFLSKYFIQKWFFTVSIKISPLFDEIFWK
ncbi:hypothetical protein JTB14_025322 [Gonioctena quinquepunctata]|nr:hypothetical protein JTB14_025322 [Gonioctena quinquepunctata]